MAREREYRGNVYSRGLPEDHEKGLMVGRFYIWGVRGCDANAASCWRFSWLRTTVVLQNGHANRTVACHAYEQFGHSLDIALLPTAAPCFYLDTTMSYDSLGFFQELKL